MRSEVGSAETVELKRCPKMIDKQHAKTSSETHTRTSKNNH